MTLNVIAKGHAALAEETERRARARLKAQHHDVIAGAPNVVELEITRIGTSIDDGTYRYCVVLTGRVVKDGARFAAFDTVRERCDVVRFAGGGSDPLSAAIAVVLATAEAMAPPPGPATGVDSKLFAATLDELTDALGRQAMR